MKELLEELQQFLLTEQHDLDDLSVALSTQRHKISDLEHEIEALKNDVQSTLQRGLS